MKQWTFDRYQNGRLMAEGARVHAKTEAEALQKAKDLFPEERGTATFRVREPEKKETMLEVHG